MIKAGDGDRTRDIQLGRLTLYQLSYSRTRLDSALKWREQDLNLCTRKRTGLQPVAFNHSAIPP